jgi:hypothetical protein
MLTDKTKLELIRNAHNWTTLQLIEEVEACCKATQSKLEPDPNDEIAVAYGLPQQRKPLTEEQIKKDFEKWAEENYVQGFGLYGASYHNGHTRNRWQGWLAAHRAMEAALGIKGDE